MLVVVVVVVVSSLSLLLLLFYYYLQVAVQDGGAEGVRRLHEELRGLHPDVPHEDLWLRTKWGDHYWDRCESNGFDRLGKKVHPGTFGEIKVG